MSLFESRTGCLVSFESWSWCEISSIVFPSFLTEFSLASFIFDSVWSSSFSEFGFIYVGSVMSRSSSRYNLRESNKGHQIKDADQSLLVVSFPFRRSYCYVYRQVLLLFGTMVHQHSRLWLGENGERYVLIEMYQLKCTYLMTCSSTASIYFA